MSQHFTYQDQAISVGDTIRVHQEISEGSKKRIQLYEGIVIAVKNQGTGKSMTVRKIGAGGVGVEKITQASVLWTTKSGATVDHGFLSKTAVLML